MATADPISVLSEDSGPLRAVLATRAKKEAPAAPLPARARAARQERKENPLSF